MACGKISFMDYTPHQVNFLPQRPGVYIFKAADTTILYVGKAINLKRRVSGYFTHDTSAEDKIRLLIPQIHIVTIVETASNFDALLLEATLIRKHQPKYNSIAKDDKSPLYVCLTLSEELPHVLFLRKTSLSTLHKKDAVFGPFQSGRVARVLMKNLRRSFPYCLQKNRNGRPCFYTHINLCNPCPSVIAKLPSGHERKTLVRTYRQNIHRIFRILSGKSDSVIRAMQTDMVKKATMQQFEEARILKKNLESLLYLLIRHDNRALYQSETSEHNDMRTQELLMLMKILAPYFPDLTSVSRIECYDIANISGTLATGSLVVASDGVMDSSQYRKFRVRAAQRPNDTMMIGEVITRRLKHPEWPYPNILIVDGGKGQIQAAQRALTEASLSIPVIGLAKRFEEIIIPVSSGFQTIRLPLTSPALVLLQRIRDEAHRFARSYHHLLRKKSFFDTIKFQP